MGNSNTFSKIQNKYGPDAVDYVAFRHNQRKNYPRIKQLVKKILDHVNLDKQEALTLIDQQKSILDDQFKKAKEKAKSDPRGYIKQLQARSKSLVEDFSGYNNEIRRLDHLSESVRSAYDQKMKKKEKTIRSAIMDQQNKSKLKKIKQFDLLSSQERKKIQRQCIRRHPEKAQQSYLFKFQREICWQNQKGQFEKIFNKKQFQKECEKIRKQILGNISLSKSIITC